MAEKTWKIGEYAKGGVITAKASKTNVTIIGKEWDFSAGSSRGSSQKFAKEFTRLSVDTRIAGSRRRIENFIMDLTTPYYTDQIMKWIESKTKFTGAMW